MNKYVRSIIICQIKPPIEVPQGAIRLNTDSQRLEFFAQDRWYEMATENASDSGSRAF